MKSLLLGKNCATASQRMRRYPRKPTFLALLSLCWWATQGAAFAVTIDFGPSFGAPETGTVVLTDQLASFGVNFSTTDPRGITWFGGDLAFEPGRYSIGAGFDPSPDVPSLIEPIRVDFSTPATSAAIRGFDGGGDTDTLILSAFDNSDNLLDSVSITDVFATPGLTASVAGPQITYITFEVTGAPRGLFFDDLSFTPVPIPPALYLFGMGLLGLIGIARR
jgi:hypothetical protein